MVCATARADLPRCVLSRTVCERIPPPRMVHGIDASLGGSWLCRPGARICRPPLCGRAHARGLETLRPKFRPSTAGCLPGRRCAQPLARRSLPELASVLQLSPSTGRGDSLPHVNDIPWAEGRWTHDPAHVEIVGDGLVVTARAGSDAWRTTAYGFIHDSEHALLTAQ